MVFLELESHLEVSMTTRTRRPAPTSRAASTRAMIVPSGLDVAGSLCVRCCSNIHLCPSPLCVDLVLSMRIHVRGIRNARDSCSLCVSARLHRLGYKLWAINSSRQCPRACHLTVDRAIDNSSSSRYPLSPSIRRHLHLQPSTGHLYAYSWTCQCSRRS
ncbi:hypothetical protein OH76DRAFT_220205 [Lentinus brumalis]|uniref:Uncharacterized protein n=1 Tax=Lentinus brumalis TaxID=2498619 RepID=A0A371CM25_9APHY|nr:hypothetical protein OH76DRAFT_220205 [Polyporus brumalis]